MDYSFRPFLEALDANWFADDPLLMRLIERFARTAAVEPPGTGGGRPASGPRSSGPARSKSAAAATAWPELHAWGERVAGPLRRLAEESARPGHEPHVRHYDAYGRRVDEVVLPASTRQALAEVEGRERLGAPHGDPFVFYAKAYLCWQNGEAGVACSMGCTDGLVRVLDALGDRPEHALVVRRVRSSSPERVWHGAQFVTEIQGGSDIGANTVRALPDGDAYRLHGRKWFCSNVNADYFLVTARPPDAPAGGAGVGLFLVPAYPEGGARRRNGHTIDRLKDKLGTRELATAELTFDGAIAYPVGPLDRGLANLVRHVLVPSRFACVISAAASLRRAERIVRAYTEFRTAFGRPIAAFPLVRDAADRIGRARDRSLAAVFGLLHAWDAARQAADGSAEAVDFRILLSLCKTVLTRTATEALHEAMMLLGGNGIEERFSSLPRLYRDAVIMETWEGPHNVLLTQALRDMARFDVAAEGFATRTLGSADPALVGELNGILDAADELTATRDFARLATRLVYGYGDRILADAGWPGA